MFMDRKYSVLEEAVECDEGRLRLFLLLLQRYTLLSGSQHFIERVDADSRSVQVTDAHN